MKILLDENIPVKVKYDFGEGMHNSSFKKSGLKNMCSTNYLY
jgi:predicted nuclease of predicted toxin-antitoxin system